MADTAPFRLGVEVELLLGSPHQRHKTWKALADELSGKLAEKAVPNYVDGGSPVKDYTQWSIAREITVQDMKSPFNYGIELVSPIYTSTSLASLAANLTTTFTTITANFPVHPTPKSSTHIHISRPGNTPFTPRSLAALANATLYFESALDALMPTRTAETYWARPNRSPENPNLAGLTLAQALAKIDEAMAAGEKDTEGDPLFPLVEAMNLVTCNSTQARFKKWTGDRVRGKTYRWDFTGLLRTSYNTPPEESYGPGEGSVTHQKAAGVEHGIAGTVEFRQPPGSRTASEALAWAVLGVAFVAGAGVVGGTLQAGARGECGTVEELWEMLERGREAVGWGDLKVLEGMFETVGKGGKA